MPYAIEVRHLTKVYDGDVKALDGIDLKVNVSDIFALLGPNGSGKTTLMRVLTTQFRPTSGEAFILGYDVVKEDASVRKTIGYVPQETSVWGDISGFENLLIYSKIYGIASGVRKKSISEALQGMGLERVAHKLVKTYSGGMVRRLEIACAMLVKPRILFLDEPTIGLDPSARKAVWENLVSFKEEYGTTVFFNTHYMDEADLYSNGIAIINRGKVVKSGTASDLKHSLHRESICLRLGRRDGGIGFGEGALGRIKALDYVIDVSSSGSELRAVVDDGEAALPQLIEALRLEGFSIERISTSKPTLDDVFLRYAGSIHTRPIGSEPVSSEELRGSV